MNVAKSVIFDEIHSLLIEYDEYIQSRLFTQEELGMTYDTLADDDSNVELLIMASDEDEMDSAISDFLSERIDWVVDSLSAAIEVAIVDLLINRSK